MFALDKPRQHASFKAWRRNLRARQGKGRKAQEQEQDDLPQAEKTLSSCVFGASLVETGVLLWRK
eukprot:753231-Hanusia_phi.AAC.2